MTTHPGHGQDLSMTTGDRRADSHSRLAFGTPELASRFVNNALPCATQLNDRARRLTRNRVDAEDLVQETMLRAYVGFDTFSDGTNLQAWLFRIMTNTYINGLRRARHRPSDYLTGHITDRQLAAQDRKSPGRPRTFAFDALDTWPDTELADALVTLPVQLRLTVYERDIAELQCRDGAESMARCECTASSRVRRGRLRLRILLLTTHERTSVAVRRRLRGAGVDAGSALWRWVRPSSSCTSPGQTSAIYG